MKEVTISYNPYTLKTAIKVDGKDPHDGLNIYDKNYDGIILQNWIDELPSILSMDFNDTDIRLSFCGTTVDYNDLCEVFKDIKNVTLEFHESLMDNQACYQKIREIFEAAKNNPNIVDKSIKDIFDIEYERIYDSLFSIAVIANMSSGKSTMINALLSNELLPTAVKECTSQITYITDEDDIEGFNAEFFDENDNSLEQIEGVDIKTITEYNYNENCKKITIFGNIPFVDSTQLKLEIIDTPGNDGLKGSNKDLIENKLSEQANDSLILYIVDKTSQSAIEYLNLISQWINKENSRFVKDKFLFVLNRMDEIRGGQETVEENISDLKMFLSNLNINDPKIFPLSAKYANFLRNLPADDINRTTISPAIMNQEHLKLESFAPLSRSQKNLIDEKLKEAIERGDFEETALIHTGIVSLEEEIKTYIEKYALTDKIRRASSFVVEKLNVQRASANKRKDLNERESEKAEINAKLKRVKKQLEDIYSLKSDLSSKIDQTDILSCVEREIENWYQEIQKIVGPLQDELRDMSIKNQIITPEKYDKEIAPKIHEFEEIYSKYKKAISEKVSSEANRFKNELRSQFNQQIRDIIKKEFDEIDIASIDIPEQDFPELEFSTEYAKDHSLTFKKKRTLNKKWSLKNLFDHKERLIETVDVERIDLYSVKKLLGKAQQQLSRDNVKLKETLKVTVDNYINDFMANVDEKYQNVAEALQTQIDLTSQDSEKVSEIIKNIEEEIREIDAIISDINSITGEL